MSDFIVGLDLGQAADYTATAVLSRSPVDGTPPGGRQALRYRFDCVHIERYPLGVSYVDIVSNVRALIANPRLQESRPWLAVDATGVGRGVVDMFLEADLPASVIPISLTSGRTARREPWNRSGVTSWLVPKNQLIAVTRALLSVGRLKIAPGPLADVLLHELLSFRAEITRAAHVRCNSMSGTHDDVLLATAIGVWFGALGDSREAVATDRPTDRKIMRIFSGFAK